MLRTGRAKNKNTDGGGMLSVSDSEALTWSPLRKTMTPPRSVRLLIMISKGISERGRGMLAKEKDSLISRPENIKKAKLNPTEKSKLTTKPTLSSLNSLTKTKPGTKVK